MTVTLTGLEQRVEDASKVVLLAKAGVEPVIVKDTTLEPQTAAIVCDDPVPVTIARLVGEEQADPAKLISLLFGLPPFQLKALSTPPQEAYATCGLVAAAIYWQRKADPESDLVTADDGLKMAMAVALARMTFGIEEVVVALHNE